MEFFEKLLHISMNIKAKRGEEALYTKEIEQCKTLASQLKNDAVIYLENWKKMQWESIFEEFIECWEEDLKIQVKHLPEFLEILNECKAVLNEFINEGVAENEVTDINNETVGKINVIADEVTDIRHGKNVSSKPKRAYETVEEEPEKKKDDVNVSDVALDEDEEFMKEVYENLRRYKEQEGNALEERNVEVQGGGEKSAVEEEEEDTETLLRVVREKIAVEEEEDTETLLRVVREELDRFYREEADEAYRKENVDPLLQNELRKEKKRSKGVSRTDPLQDRQQPQCLPHNHSMVRQSTKKRYFSDDSPMNHLAAPVPSLHRSLEKSLNNPVIPQCILDRSDSKSGGRVQSAKSILKTSLKHHHSSPNITAARCLNFSHMTGAPSNSSKRLFSISSSTPYFNETMQTSSTTSHETFLPLNVRKIDKVTFKLTPDYKVISDDSGSLNTSDSYLKKLNLSESNIFYNNGSFHRDASLNSNRSSFDNQTTNAHGDNNKDFLKQKTPRSSRSAECLVRKGVGDDYDDDIAVLVAPSARSGIHELSSRFGFKQFYEKKCQGRIE